MINDTLWLIAARSGSKGIVNKNIKLLDCIPLMNYRIKSISSFVDKSNIWLSTDSKLYADLGKKHGIKVPFIRPEKLSGDDASSNDVVLHAMNYAEKNHYSYSYIALIEPTSPFVYPDDIINALDILNSNYDADSIVSTKETHINTAFIQDESKYLDIVASNIEKLNKTNRQSLKKQITPSGGFYISRWDKFIQNKSFYTKKTLSYQLNKTSALEIDTQEDWDWAEFLINKKMINYDKLWKKNS